MNILSFSLEQLGVIVAIGVGIPTLPGLAARPLGRVWRLRVRCRAERDEARARRRLAEAREIAEREGASSLVEVTIPLRTSRDRRAARLLVERGLAEIRGDSVVITVDRRPTGALAELGARWRP